MIRHIFKIIWNERRINFWIMLEYIVVFCILWFCCDFLWFIGKNYLEDPGFDIKHTYIIKMGKKDIVTNENEDMATQADLFAERVSRFPGVENLSFSRAAIPYSNNSNQNSYMVNRDTIWQNAWYKSVTSGFFDVYQIMLASGRRLEENDQINRRNLVISPNRDGSFGLWDAVIPANEVHTLSWNLEKPEEDFHVVGVYEKNKRAYSGPYQTTVFQYMHPSEKDLSYIDISVRVSPDADKDFAESFTTQMREQLFIGPYFLISVVPSHKIKKIYVDSEVTNNLNSVLAITGFLMVNIFLGLIGTFWTRTQSRRSEIGLRIALGSSRHNVQWIMFAEIFIMLFLSSILSTYICYNLAQTDLLSSLGIPLAERDDAGIGSEQNIINYLVTFVFLALVSCLAVWYPARQSAHIAPAEALRAE